LKTSRATCLRQLDSIREAARDSEGAYLVRTRLRRALLSAARHVAELEGASKPEMPGHYVAPRNSSPHSRAVIETCNRLYSESQVLCTPSEAFDTRWKKGWQTLRTELDLLERLLRQESGVAQAAQIA
jgi:aspartate/methionine/tyrosine aminotransferase